MKKTKAEWTCNLFVECPYCGEYQEINFEEIDEWWCYFGAYREEFDGLEHEFECKECGKEFIINGSTF